MTGGRAVAVALALLAATPAGAQEIGASASGTFDDAATAPAPFRAYYESIGVTSCSDQAGATRTIDLHFPGGGGDVTGQFDIAISGSTNCDFIDRPCEVNASFRGALTGRFHHENLRFEGDLDGVIRMDVVSGCTATTDTGERMTFVPYRDLRGIEPGTDVPVTGPWSATVDGDQVTGLFESEPENTSIPFTATANGIAPPEASTTTAASQPGEEAGDEEAEVDLAQGAGDDGGSGGGHSNLVQALVLAAVVIGAVVTRRIVGGGPPAALARVAPVLLVVGLLTTAAGVFRSVTFDGGEPAGSAGATTPTTEERSTTTAPPAITASTSPPTTAAPATAHCENPTEGYALDYPADWFTDSSVEVPPCRAFNPQAFDLESSADFVPIAISVGPIESDYTSYLESYDAPQDGTLTVEERVETTVAGQPAVRYLYSYPSEATPPPIYEYIVNRNGQVFLLTALGEHTPDFDAAKAALDVMATSLVFS